MAAKFSGLGLRSGRLTVCACGVWTLTSALTGQTGKFSPETRRVVIASTPTASIQPSGTGCHVVGLGKLPIEPTHKREVLVRPFPGAKQIEIKGLGFYFTFTEPPLEQVPRVLLDRQTEILALYDSVLKIPPPTKEHDGLVVTVYTH